MDIRIGIKHSSRELSFESAQSPEEIEKLVEAALASSAKLLTLSDAKGNRYLVPSDSITYLEIGGEETRRVGFIA